MHSKIKWKTDSHTHIVFSPNNSTLLFILLEILFIPFLSNNHTQYSKNTMEPLLDIFLFHSLQRLVQFSSVTSWHGFCFTISLMDSLGVLGCVFYASPQIQSWILCVASELRSDWFSLCEPPPWQAASDWTRLHRICVNRGELHGTKAQQIQTVGEIEVGLGGIAINPLCRVNIFGTPQIGTLCVPSALIFPSLHRIESPKLATKFKSWQIRKFNVCVEAHMMFARAA